MPEYGGACVASVVPALLEVLNGNPAGVPSWLPEPVREARQILLLVIDGVGWEYLGRERASLPALGSGQGGPITSVVPTTTATCLTSIVTGTVPAGHGLVGYRMRIGAAGAGAGGVMNVLRWKVDGADARVSLPPRELQRAPAFGGLRIPALTRTEFTTTGFTAAHLGDSRLVTWRQPSSLVVDALAFLRGGERFVYAYVDGPDSVAHQHGLGDHYAAELRYVDWLVGELAGGLPPGAALVVISDHGQVGVEAPSLLLPPEVMSLVQLISGEARFRWLHARPGAEADLVAVSQELFGEIAWVRSRRSVIDEGWFGGPLSTDVAARLGDVALVARDAASFLDPSDTGELRLRSRHGSLTPPEMLVPLLAWAG
jgi:predicted AlkP superfamily pyrophosphatase or phosphodiesterase